VTLPLTSGVSASLPPPPQVNLEFPLTWLLNTAPAPLQYRATNEIARLHVDDVARFAGVPYTYKPALALAIAQEPDGTWGAGMLSIPGPRADGFQGVGTISAVRRLLEYGWDRESPPLIQARRTLFRLLAEDDDAAYLYELGSRGKPEVEAIRHGRTVLREAAAAALAQAGYENDPRLRGAARRIVTRLDAFLRSPLATKPFIRVGNHHVLAPEGAPPSVHTLLMLAHMPLFRSEHYDVMDRLFQFLAQPQPRQVPASMVAKKIVDEPYIVLGDPLPHRSAADADVPTALFWLELFARLQFLRRGDQWNRLYDRFLDDRDAEGVWRAPRRTATMKSGNSYVWPMFPLDTTSAEPDRVTDVTFRLGLIGRLSGRAITLV